LYECNYFLLESFSVTDKMPSMSYIFILKMKHIDGDGNLNTAMIRNNKAELYKATTGGSS